MTGRSLALVLAVLSAVLLGVAAPAAAGEVGDAAVLATDSAQLNRSSKVTGDVAVNNASTQTLVPGFELSLERSALVTGNASADSVQLEMLAVVTGTIACNNGSGVVCTGLGLPVFPALPPFQAADVRPQANPVPVGAGQTVSLPAGEYGDVTIAQTGTLVLLGGVYDLRSVSPVTTAGGQCPYPCRSVMFAGPSDVRVQGRFDTSKDSCVAPGTTNADCPARTPAAVGALSGATGILYVGGANGGDGSANALPPAATVGKDSVLAATVYAPNGTVLIDQSSVATGALLGRHVKLDRNANLKGDSFFGNRPPTADPQDVFTLGAASIDITLTASDPNGDSLFFSIVAGSGPTQGTLSGLTQNQAAGQCSLTVLACTTNGECPAGETCVLPPVTSATVTYTPNNPSLEEEDSFFFKVTDPSNASSQAKVRINPPGDPTEPPPVTAVSANPTSVETLQGTPVAVTLAGQVPSGFSLTFTIVSGPGNGTLGSIAQVSPNTATVTYTPAAGFTGTDSFVFRAAADLNNDGDTLDPGESATATATIVVAPASQTQADNQTVTTPFETPVEITLTGAPGSGGLLSLPGRVMIPGEAAFLEGSEIAGNVGDEDRDGFGDNHNDLPGPAPVLMAAAVDATGGAGSNGILRMQIEWDVSELTGLAPDLESAEVLLTTEVGTIDSLDTFWYPVTADEDGLLTDDDYESEVDTDNLLATMPVPDEPAGTQGSFSFDVLDELLTAIVQDQQYFSIQGRVDESLDTNGEGPIQRGLQVHTTADGNLPDLLHPQLALATPGVVGPLTFTVLTLPKTSLGQPIGTLKNSLGALITSVPATLPDALVTFTPALEFTGVGSFQFQAADGLTTGNATVTLVVESGFGFGDCLGSETFCNQGRGGTGGGGLGGGADTEADVALRVKVKGRGDVSSHPRQIKAGRVVGLFCASQCTAHFPDRETVALYARPAEAGWVFAGWGGDCSGNESMTLVQMTRERECTATFVRERGSRKKE